MDSITNAHIIGMLAAVGIFFAGALAGAYWQCAVQAIARRAQDAAVEAAEGSLMRKAVALGAARWVVDDDGYASFQWNEPPMDIAAVVRGARHGAE